MTLLLETINIGWLEVSNLMKNKIKEYRIIRNLTQADLAQKVGVRRETIIYLEKGRYTPSLKLAHDVAKTLKTKIDKLFVFK